jgi:predicted ATPase
MITRIEAKRFRCLRYVSQELGPFHVLVGPNASGKSSFMDVLGFFGRLMRGGLKNAIQQPETIYDLFWGRQGNAFELAIEAEIPDVIRKPNHLFHGDRTAGIRYEVAVGLDATGLTRLLREQLLLRPEHEKPDVPAPAEAAVDSLFIDPQRTCWHPLVRAQETGKDYFHLNPEEYDPSRPDEDDYQVLHRPSKDRSLLAGLSPVEFPSAIWLEGLLSERIVQVNINPKVLRNPAKPGQGDVFLGDGANFPWLVQELETRDPERYRDWVGHVRTVLRDVEGVRVVNRPEDLHRYLMVRYVDGLEIPSWSLSEGTLCLLALTFLAYWRYELGTVYLVEEPESHIHPLNIEPIVQSLSSVYEGQVLLATHSPSVLTMTDESKILVFSRDKEAGVSIVRGDRHPRLRHWRREVSLGDLFASGVLG